MTGPQRVQMSRRRPWRAEHPDAVIVARPSRWGNPFQVHRDGAMWAVRSPLRQLNRERIGSRETATRIAVELFRLHHGAFGSFEPDRVDEWLEPLQGRDLACWCPLDGPCHADVLLAWANQERP